MGATSMDNFGNKNNSNSKSFNERIKYYAGVPILTEKLKNKYNIFLIKTKNIFNTKKNKIENWKKIIDELKIKNNFEQLREIISILEYKQNKNVGPLRNNLEIDLIKEYNIEGEDDMVHIMTAASLLEKGVPKELILNGGIAKEKLKDIPSKTFLLLKAKIKILILKFRLNNTEEKEKLIEEIKKIKKELPKKTFNLIIKDSIQDLKSNAIGIVLGEYLKKYKNKTIYDFFVELKINKELQTKYKKIANKYALTSTDFDPYPMNNMF